MASEENEQKRREIIRRLEQDKARVETQLATTQEERAALEAALLRAYHPPHSNDVCLTCWV